MNMNRLHPSRFALVAACVATVATASPPAFAAQQDAPAASEAGCAAPAPKATKPKKKKGFGLGGLLSAAKRAGVGDMLGSGLLGDSEVAQVAGAVTSTAVNVAEGGDPTSALAGQIPYGVGNGRTGQIVSVVAGTAVEAAKQAAARCAAQQSG